MSPAWHAKSAPTDVGSGGTRSHIAPVCPISALLCSAHNVEESQDTRGDRDLYCTRRCDRDVGGTKHRELWHPTFHVSAPNSSGAHGCADAWLEYSDPTALGKLSAPGGQLDGMEVEGAWNGRAGVTIGLVTRGRWRSSPQGVTS